MSRPGFTLVQRQGALTLEMHGHEAGGARTFTSYVRGHTGFTVFLGRLFYRSDLTRRLGSLARRGSAADSSDAELVMAAYERWGHAGLALLEGDFAVAIYDALERCLIGFRDPLGGYPLYYRSCAGAVCVGTSLARLVQQSPQIVVSDDGLADYLSLHTFGFQQPDGDASIFEGVNRVRIGDAVRLDLQSGDTKRVRYWDWPGAVAETDGQENRSGAVHERFAGLLRDAVHERCTDTTAAQLSGGMDSTSVALLAAAIQPDCRPVHTVSLVYEQWSALARETPFLQEALRAHPNLVQHVLVADEIHDFDPYLNPPHTDEPWPGLYRVAAEASMYEEAAKAGASSMLTGAGGDEVATLPPFDVADRLREGRPRAAWQAATKWASAFDRNVWEVFWPCGVVPLLPPPLRAGLGTYARRGRTRWPTADQFWIPPWIRADFARKNHMYERALRGIHKSRSLASSFQVSDSLNMIVSRNGDMIRWYLGSPRGIHTGNPFLDPRVIRYALAVRARTTFEPGQQKALLSDAMQGVLPDRIRSRRRKGNFSEAYFIGLSRHAEVVTEMIEQAPVDELGFLDKDVLLQCFREYRMARASDVRAGGRMTIVLAVLNWLSHYREWIHESPPVNHTHRVSID